jgi:hypothetical protein
MLYVWQCMYVLRCADTTLRGARTPAQLEAAGIGSSLEQRRAHEVRESRAPAQARPTLGEGAGDESHRDLRRGVGPAELATDTVVPEGCRRVG